MVPLSLSFSSVERGGPLPCLARRTGFETPVRQRVNKLRHWKDFCKCDEMTLWLNAPVASPSEAGTICHPIQQTAYTWLLHLTFRSLGTCMCATNVKDQELLHFKLFSTGRKQNIPSFSHSGSSGLSVKWLPCEALLGCCSPAPPCGRDVLSLTQLLEGQQRLHLLLLPLRSWPPIQLLPRTSAYMSMWGP